MAQALYEFTWHEYCDWYLELTKPVLNDERADPAAQRAAQATLVEVLGAILKLLHPIVPFVTEELWLELSSRTGVSSDTIMLAQMPEEDDFPADPQAHEEIAWLKGVVAGIRQIRGEANIGPGTQLTVRLADASGEDRTRAERHGAYLQKLAGIGSLEVLPPGAAVRGAATALFGGMRILVPLAGLIDTARERERLDKQLAKAADDLQKALRKLENQNFVANAPPDVVAKERARVAELEQRSQQLQQQLARLAELD
jgi:valyl-tRNA synthetase